MIDLLKLYHIFNKLYLDADNNRKCFIELRPFSSGFYKGIIYCKTAEEAYDIELQLNNILKGQIEHNYSTNVKRGCTEFGLEFPNYNEVSPDGNTLMDYDNNWKFFETEHDLRYPKQHTSKSRKNLKELSLKNLLIIKNWVAYANGIGIRPLNFYLKKSSFK